MGRKKRDSKRHIKRSTIESYKNLDFIPTTVAQKRSTTQADHVGNIVSRWFLWYEMEADKQLEALQPPKRLNTKHLEKNTPGKDRSHPAINGRYGTIEACAIFLVFKFACSTQTI